MACLFCNKDHPFQTVEHIIPESLGNKELILRQEVCDKCQNYLSQNERYVLSNTSFGFWRTILSIKTKKRKLPFADFTKDKQQHGVISDFHPEHDNFAVQGHPDFTTELIVPGSILQRLDENGRGQLKYVLTPKVIYEIGRFLGKIGLELVCLNDNIAARGGRFDDIRKYVREGSIKEHWPIFHAANGTIKDLFTYTDKGEAIEEEVLCYSYAIREIGQYLMLNFVIGTDSWLICLNDRYPTPIILSTFPDQKFRLVWYSEEELK